MKSPLLLLAGGILLGAIGVILASDRGGAVRAGFASLPGMSWAGSWAGSGHALPRQREHPHEQHEEDIKLSAEQIEAAEIKVSDVTSGVIARRLAVPGTILPNGDRIARVSVKLLGTVAELRKRLGDHVERNEVVAVIESREVADAKTEYLSARFTHDLQETLTERAKRLVDIKAMSENDYLRARAAFDDARAKQAAARQKLFALGLTEQQVASLQEQPAGALQQQELRSPIAGVVAERRVDLGGLVGREGQESELFVIVDLSDVWVELALAPADLAHLAQGQEIAVRARADGDAVAARVTFIGPLLDKETRLARVVAVLSNPNDTWKPGEFVTAEVRLAPQPVAIAVPKSALQSIKGARAVFVRTDEGFRVRTVVTSREDDRGVEITSGLTLGERIAVTNTFTLKAELGKSEAHED
jgi:membrane fusion protein, heavy metal efflux system